MLSEKAYELAKPSLPDQDAENVRAFIYDYNEWGLGVETMVDVLLERQIPVSNRQKEAIAAAMEAMGLDRHQSELEVSPSVEKVR